MVRSIRLAAGIFLNVPGGSWLALADNPLYNGAVAVAILWFATLLNIVGLERAKWLQNVGAMATWCAGALILGGGLMAWRRYGAATPIAATALLPELGKLSTLVSFATIALADSGLELGLILGDEIRDPRRTIPRAAADHAARRKAARRGQSTRMVRQIRRSAADRAS